MRQPARPAPSPLVLRPVCLAACLLCGPAAYALPQGGTPTFGQTDIRLAAPGQLLINQGTARAGIDWTSFSIAAGERVQIVQPGRDSVLVNRVVGNDPSAIFGQLQSNGNVWLVNPRGIFFGASSRVDVGGLVATTLNLEGSGAEGGRLRLGRGSEGAGEIRSEGRITARDGTVVLAAPQVTQSGTIEAHRVGIAAATQVEVDVEGDGLVFFNARNDGSLPARLSLLGNVLADGGTADLRAAARAGFADTVLNLEGVVRARTIGQRNGRVFIDGGSDGAVIVTGTVDASGSRAGERGGDVTITGDKVGLATGSTVDASGDSGGGRIRVGGGFHGADGDLRNAGMVVVQTGATLKANAGERGDGGQVVVWSERSTAFGGEIQARGGAQGGDGGQAEVSSKGHLDFQGRADLGARLGRFGTLLLDPDSIEIVDTGPDLHGDGSNLDLGSTQISFAEDAGNASKITDDALIIQLGNGSVELQATGDITVTKGFSFTASNNTLTLRARNDVIVNDTVTVKGGVNLFANDDATGGGAVRVAAAIGSNGTVAISGAGNAINATVTAATVEVTGDTSMNGSGVIAGALHVKGGTFSLGGGGNLGASTDVALDTGTTLALPPADVTIGLLSGTGAVALANGKDLTLGGSGSSSFGGTISGGNSATHLVKTGSGTLSLTGPVSVAGGVTINGGGTLDIGDDVGRLGGGTLAFNNGTLIVSQANYTIANDVTLNGAGTVQNAGTNSGTLSGTFSGGGDFTKAGGGSLTLDHAGYTGNTRVAGGTLTLDSGTSLVNTSTLTVDAGAVYTLSTFDLIAGLSLSGTLNGAATLNVTGTTTLSGGTLAAGTLLSTTTLGSSGGTINGTTSAGTLNLTGGTLVLGSAGRLTGTTALTVAGGATLQLGGNESTTSLNGNGTVNLGSATLSTGGGTFAGTLSGGAGAGLTKTGAGTFTLTGIADYDGTTTVSNGTLVLGSAERLKDGSALVIGGNGTLTLGGNETVASANIGGALGGAFTLTTTGTTTLAGGTVALGTTLGGAALASSGSSALNGTSAATGVTVNDGTLLLGSAGRLTGAPSITVDAGAALTLGGNETLGGTLGGGGTVGGIGTLTSSGGTTTLAGIGIGSTVVLGDATLAVGSGSSTLDGTSAASTVNLSGGALTLGGTNRFTAAPTLNLGGTATLNLGGNQGFAGGSTFSGTLGGSGTLTTAGSTTTLSGATVGANVVLGDSTLAVGSGSSSTLDGTSTASIVNLSGGALTLGGANRFTAAPTLNLGVGAILNLGGNQGFGAASTFGGTLGGSGMLTTVGGSITLAGATVGANVVLGDATLAIGSGSSTLNGTSTASTVNFSGGTLTLGSANRFTAAPTLNLGGGSTLNLGGNQGFASASTFSGTLGGSGTLTTTGGATSLNGATVGGTLVLGDATLDSTGGSTLNATSAATTVHVNGGSLTLGSAGRLSGAPNVTVATGATLALGGNETLGGTLGGGGTVSGSGTLTSSGGTTSLAGITIGSTVVLGDSTLAVGSGSSTLNGTSTASTVNLSGGSLTLGSANRFTAAPTLNLGGAATLTLGGNQGFASASTFGGTLGGSGTLTTTGGSTTLSGATVGGTLVLGDATLDSTGGSTLNATSAATTVHVNGGSLTLGSAGRLSGAPNVTVATGATLALGGNETLGGTLGGGGTVSGSGTLTSSGGTTSLAGITIGSTVVLGDSTLAVGSGSSTLNGTSTASTVNLSGGSLTLGSANRFTAAPTLNLGGAATLTLGGNQGFASASTFGGTLGGSGTLTTTGGSTTLSGATVGGTLVLGDATLDSTGGSTLNATSAATTVHVNGGSLTLGSAGRLSGAPNVTVATGATLALGGNETLGGTLGGGGTVSGSGTLTSSGGTTSLAGITIDTAVVLGDATLNSTGGTLKGRTLASIVNVQSGTLTLSGVNSLGSGADVNVATDATLALGRDQSSGTLSGAGTVDVGSFTFSTGTKGASTFDGLITGTSGGFTKSGSSTFTLNGSTAYTGTTTVSGGTLVLGAAERLANGGTLAVAGGATLVLNFAETVNAASVAGTLSGGGTLSAGTVALTNGAIVNANLGGGTLTSNGSVALNGTSAAATVQVQSGTLALGSANRLADSADLSVASGATLTLNGADTVGTLTLAGTLGGGGTLTATTTYALNNGAVVSADLGTGTLTSNGGVTLDGTAAATTVNVATGTLTLGAPERLADGATLTLAAPATLLLSTGTETVAQATLAGHLAGTGTLVAARYDLAGATVDANLGAGDLHAAGGSSRLNGTAGALKVFVDTTGTLVVGSADRLADAADVSVAGGATLTLLGDDRVHSLALAGTVGGPGKLRADSYLINGGTFNGDIVGGQLTVNGDSTLNGTSSATTVSVGSGTLTLGAADRLTAAPAVDIAGGAAISVIGDETFGSLAGSGRLDLVGGSTVFTGSRQSSRFDGSITGAGGNLTKQGSGTSFTLGGASSFGGTLDVAEGTLALTAGASLAPGLQVLVGHGVAANNAVLDTAAATRVATVSVDSGRLTGSGSLGAATVTLANGSADVVLVGTTLSASGTSLLDAGAGFGSVSVGNGTLTLGANGHLTGAPAVAIASGATLALAGDQTFGSLAGAGNLALGSATLTTGDTHDTRFDGVIGGSGNLVKQGSGSFTLAGANTYGGRTTVAAGSLVLAGAERLADTSALTVANGATLRLNGDERVADATLSGLLAGSGTLGAASMALAGGTADADLATTTLHSSGSSRLNGHATVAALAVDGGTLTLGSAARLAGAPAVAVAGGATLALGGAETFGSLAGDGTVALGSATLSTGNASDSVFGGRLEGGGALVKQGTGSFTLAGANTYTGGTQVAAGTLVLAADDRLADGGAVDVQRGATLVLGGNDTVARLDLQGTLGGSGTLTAATYALDGASVNASLGAGALTSIGASSIAGSVAPTTLAVNGGTLTLAAPDRMADGTAVSIASGATLALTGNDTVKSLLVNGTLGGSGRLTAGDITLEGGRVVADLGGATLTSRGASRLEGQATVPLITVEGGELVLASAGRLGGAPAVMVAGTATLTLGGNETLGKLAGAGTVALGSATLATGSGGPSSFEGALTGTGGLDKQGSGDFVLSGSSTYTGSTRVESGALVLADGARLATSGFVVDGTLRFAPAGGHVQDLAVPVSGSGALELAGNGELRLSGPGKTYGGATRVLAGTLSTAGADELPDASAVAVSAGATLALGGAEAVASLDTDLGAHLVLGGDFSTGGAMNLQGDVVYRGAAPITLSGTRIDAVNDGNDWGPRLSISASGPLALSSGRVGGTAAGALRDLVLGELDLGAGGRVDAGLITLDGVARLGGGHLTLASAAVPVGQAAESAFAGTNAPGGRPIGFASDVVVQAAGHIDVAAGAQLSVISDNGGSIRLLAEDNHFAGTLEVRSGPANSAWSPHLQPVGAAETAVQGRVQVAGDTVTIGGAGIEADVVVLRADRLSTAPGAVIVARLPFDNRVGTADSLPGLTLELTPVAFGLPFPFGQNGAEIAVNVGSRAWGGRTLPIDGGYLRVLPRHGAQGSTVVALTGPLVSGSYSFFFDGAGQSGEIPVFYNGLLPLTPEISGSLSATLAVSEGARRDRFDESVRTENVAVRLRAGVIAEVGPGRPATVGSEGIRAPAGCAPAGASLACEAN